MTSTCIASRLFVAGLILQQILISVTAFGLHPLGLRSVKSRANMNVNEKLERVKLEGRRRRWDLEDEDSVNTISSNTTNQQRNRNQFLLDCRSYLTCGLVASTAAASSWSAFPDAGNAKSYSENAKNLDRINNGDFSGGAVFDNNPKNERGQKRRAMTGCKDKMSREEASSTILKRGKTLSEKECNTMVMEGETDFMLQALRNLDCPTCPKGIGKMD